MKLVFRTMPPSTNHLYGRGKSSVFLKEDVRTAKEAIGWEARSQYPGEPLPGPLKVTVDLFWPDRRKHDIDNGLKLLLDALTGIVWEDDDQVSDLRVRKAIDQVEPRVEVEVQAIY